MVAHRDHRRTVSQQGNKRESRPGRELELSWAHFSLQPRAPSRAKRFLSTAWTQARGVLPSLAPSRHECADRKSGWAGLGGALPASALCSSPVKSDLPVWTAQPRVLRQPSPDKCHGPGALRGAAATQMTVVSFCRQPRGGEESPDPPLHLWVFAQLPSPPSAADARGLLKS